MTISFVNLRAIMKKTNIKLQDASLLLLRLSVAAVFLYASYAKWQFLSSGAEGLSAGMVYLTRFLMVVEPLGAIALIAGFLTRWAAAGLGIIMVGAIIILSFTMQASFFTAPQAPGLDYNLLILSGCIVLIAFGAGRCSVDSRWKRKK